MTNQAAFNPAKIQQLMQQGQFREADQYLGRALTLQPNNTSLLNAAAHVAQQLQQPERAVQLLRQSLQLQPSQAQVHLQLAHLLLTMHAYPAAVQHYELGIHQAADNPTIQFNYALALKKANRLKKCREVVEGSLKQKQPAKFYVLAGELYSQLGEYVLANEVYEQGLQLYPQDVGLLCAQSLALRIKGQAGTAAELFTDLPQQTTESPYILLQQALCAAEQGDLQGAKTYFAKSLALAPLNIQAHEALNKLLWEHSDQESFLQSYTRVLEDHPASAALHYSRIAMNLMANQFTEAAKNLAIAKQHLPLNHELLHLEGVIASRLNDSERAQSLFESALKQAPHVSRYNIDLANMLLKKGEYQRVGQLLESNIRFDPYNQEYLAYLGLCWRLMGDTREQWLNNYDQFVHAQQLPLPAGYSSFNTFWQEFRGALQGLHQSDSAPLDQSVMNGVQTSGQLLALDIKPIQDYKWALSELVRDYVHGLPQDANHPFLQRNTRQFYFSGSWSVMLKGKGYHTNHVHPQGWLSSCTYVTVPDYVKAGDPTFTGWLKYGETSLGLGEREAVAKRVRPEEGVTVLFPAYFWHGTYPIVDSSNQVRMTAPNDIEPLF